MAGNTDPPGWAALLLTSMTAINAKLTVLQEQLDATAECQGCVDPSRRSPHVDACPNHRDNW